MEVDEDQWKPRDKLLLVEAVTSGAAGGGNGAGNGNRGDSGGQDGKRDVNWAAVSRLLRKHIPKKRLTTPTSFGSKRCMAMYDTQLARHGIPAGAQSLSASNGTLAEGLDRVVAALREEYMNHLRKSIELCDSEIEKSTERMTRINAGDLDEELLAHYEEEKRFRAAGQSPPAAASVVGTASPPRKRRSLEDNGKSPLDASAVAPASPLPAGTDAPSSPLSPAQPPTKKARREPPHAEDATAVVDTTTSTGVGRNGAPTEPPPAAPASRPAETEAEASTEPTKAVAEAAEPTAVESAQVGELQGAPQLESDQTLSSSVPLETPTMTAVMLGMVVEEPLPLPVVSSLSSAPASPASLAQQETWTQQPQLLPTPDDLAASLAYHDPLLVETSASYANADAAADAAESVELQPAAAEPNSRDAVEAAEPLRPAAGEVDAATATATATAPTSVTEDNAPPLVVVVSAATAPEEAAGPKQDSLAPTAAAPEGIKKDQPSPNAGASFSTDLLWENFETEALPTVGAGEKGDHDAMIEEAAKPPPADTKASPQGETQTEMDVEVEAEAEAEAASFNEEDDRGKKEVKEEREEAALETEKDETRRDDAKATEVEQADVEKKEEEQEGEEEEEEEPVVVEQKKPRGRPKRQSVNTAKRTYKRRKPAAEAEEKEAEAEEVKTVVVIDDQDEDGVKVEASASGEEAKKRPMKEKRVQQAKKETMKAKESEEEEEKKEAKDDEENEAETKNEDEEEEESGADDMEAEAEAAVRRVEMEGVRRVLATVKAHHYAKPFLQPVSVEDVPEYPRIIYRPMDFTTITNRIKTGVISSKIEFLRDMYLLFQNAFIFNPKGSDIYVMASTLKTLTKTEMREVDREVEVVRKSFPPAARPKKNPVSTATTTATPEPKKGANKESKKATTAAPRLAEANRKRRR